MSITVQLTDGKLGKNLYSVLAKPAEQYAITKNINKNTMFFFSFTFVQNKKNLLSEINILKFDI